MNEVGRRLFFKLVLGCGLNLMFLVISGMPGRAAVTSLSDLVSSQLINAAADHTLTFTTSANAAEGSTLTVSFASAFDTSTIDFTDLDFLVGGVNRALAGDCAGTEQVGVTVVNDVITLTICPGDGGAIPASSVVIIRIGTVAVFGAVGDQQIRNPGATGSYSVAFGGSFGDQGQLAMAIVSPGGVTVIGLVGGGQTGGGGEITGVQQPAGDTSAPIISNIQVTDITRTSARVIWETNEAANSFVDYGLTVSYEIGTATDAALVVSHSLALVGLAEDTLHHFRVRSRDAAGNQIISSDFTFRTLPPPDTTPPTISDIQVLNITGETARVAWATNESATSRVEFGLSINYELGSREDLTLTLDHSQLLTGLASENRYHFRVRSRDAAGNESVSIDREFQTADVTAPVLSQIEVTEITETNVRVNWLTNESSDSRLAYGLTAEYTLGTLTDSALTTNHGLTLIGLEPATIYHFQVRSQDAAGNLNVSSDQTFLTRPDRQAPANVSGFTAAQLASGEVEFVWNNPPDRDLAGVRIMRQQDRAPVNAFDGELVFDGLAVRARDPGVQAGLTYVYGAFAYDRSANFASGALTQISTFLAGPISPEISPPTLIPPSPPLTLPSEVLPTQPPLPPTTVPVEQQISLEEIKIEVGNGTLQLEPQNKVVSLVNNSIVRISLPKESLPREPSSVILEVKSDRYLLGRTADGFSTDILAPAVPGLAPLTVSVVYPDGASDRVESQTRLESSGRIVSRIGQTLVPVAGALVTLLDATGQEWVAIKYRQDNPQRAKSDGTFFWYAPNGQYEVRAVKDGFRSETIKIAVTNYIVNPQIELIELPPPLFESAKNILASAESPLIKAGAVAKLFSQEINYGYEIARVQVLDNPAVEQVAENVAAPALATVTVASAGAAATTAAGLSNVLNLARFLVTQPLLLVSRRKRKGYGVVYNAMTKLPVDLAIVRLKDAATGRFLQTRVTDRGGRYFFIVQPGKYLLDVHKASFSFPSGYLKEVKQDALFLDLYHGESIEVTERGATIFANIPVDPEVKEKLPAQIVRRLVWQKVGYLISSVSPLLALVALAIQPTSLTVGLFIGQVVFYGGLRYLAKPRLPKGWGLVTDAETNQPLGRAIIRIFEPIYNKLLEMQVTDSHGRYSFLVGPNIYRAHFEKEGYLPQGISQIDYRNKKEPTLLGMDVKLSPRKETGEWKEEPL